LDQRLISSPEVIANNQGTILYTSITFQAS